MQPLIPTYIPTYLNKSFVNKGFVCVVLVPQSETLCAHVAGELTS